MPVAFLRFRPLALLWCCLLLGARLAADLPWPAVESDLPPDPAVRAGMLPNGLRYAIRPHSVPQGRVSLRLVVRVGSLHERDDERGLAHFVEHMVFRGTRTHPDGQLTPALQRLGMAPGPDSTAFTLFNYTIYHLELPDTDETTLRQGLKVFREYAEEVTFEENLIERERGVILSEKNTRDTPGARAQQAHLAFLWPGARQNVRSPIGTEAAVRTVTRAQFVDFYHAWYRPERMAVVIVGDTAPALAERVLTEVLAPLQPRGPAREDAIDDTPTEASNPDVRVFSDAGLIGANCTFVHPFREPRVADTRARRTRDLHRALAFAMFQRRVETHARQSDGQFVGPSASVSAALPGWATAGFSVSGTINDWQTFMGELEREHRRAYLHGFTAAELAVARTSFATHYEEAVRTATTWPSDWIAGQLAQALVEGRVFSTPALLRDDAAPALAAATLDDCVREFRTAWTARAPHVFVATHPAFAVPTKEIARALNTSREQAVAPPVERALAPFAYTDFGPPGTVAEQSHAADLDIHQAVFANGVRVNFKATPFEADTVELSVRVGTGKLSQPRDQPGLDLLANLLVPQGGLGRHTFEELRDLLASHSVNIRSNVDTDAFAFTARCARRDLPLCLQVIAAHLTDSAYREDALREIRASFGSYYASMASSPGGPISLFALRELAGGDPRFGAPLPVELEARTIAEVRAWLEPQFKSGPIELSIVGDTTWDEATTAVAATLGALSPRPAHRSLAAPPPLHPRAKPAKPTYVYTTEPHVKLVALAWYCPVPVDDIRAERRWRLLADLIAERLRVSLREELGAVYGCEAGVATFDGFPNFNVLSIYTEVAPGAAERANQIIRKTLDALQRKRFTDDEFARVKIPFLRSRTDDLRENSYWAYTVLADAQQRPVRLAAARDRQADTAAISRLEIARLAAQHFKANRWFQFVAYPRSK